MLKLYKQINENNNTVREIVIQIQEEQLSLQP